MPASKKPRKSKGKRLYGGMSALAYRMICRKKMSDEKQLEVLTDYYAAIDAFLQGRAEFTHFEKLVYAANVTRVLADMGFGDDHTDLIEQGMIAVQQIKERHDATGKWGIDGNGRRALFAMEDLHRAQLEIATEGEVAAAIQGMWRRINIGNKFKIPEAA